MKRSFCIGSEWIYFKLYLGPKTADIVLLEKIKNIVLYLEKKKIINLWFFIRYNDPDYHLRIRFKCSNTNNIFKVIKILYPILNELIEEDILWKVQTDLYQREIERYGESTIEDSEMLFYQDSLMILKYIEVKPSFNSLETSLLFSFISIDQFLSVFEFDLQSRYELLNRLQLAYKDEFEFDKKIKAQYDKNYRSLQDKIHYFISREAEFENKEIFKILKDKHDRIHEIAISVKSNITIDLNDFMASHIHMMINRQYTSKQRHYETLIYDHMWRYYKYALNKNTYKL